MQNENEYGKTSFFHKLTSGKSQSAIDVFFPTIIIP